MNTTVHYSHNQTSPLDCQILITFFRRLYDSIQNHVIPSIFILPSYLYLCFQTKILLFVICSGCATCSSYRVPHGTSPCYCPHFSSLFSEILNGNSSSFTEVWKKKHRCLMDACTCWVGLESREYGHRDLSRWTPGTLYLQKLALSSPTIGQYSLLADSAHGVFLCTHWVDCIGHRRFLEGVVRCDSH
jgi:hypothetical protein